MFGNIKVFLSITILICDNVIVILLKRDYLYTFNYLYFRDYILEIQTEVITEEMIWSVRFFFKTNWGDDLGGWVCVKNL